MTKESKGKEYEPGTLQTYRNGLQRYFLERPCPLAVDNFDLKKSSGIELKKVSMMLSMKKKDLKQKGLGNKANAAQPVETKDIEKMWSSGAIGLQNPRSLLHLVWWNNGTSNTKSDKPRTARETNRLRQNRQESTTTRFGGRMVESKIRTEHLSSTLAIVRMFLEISSQVQLTAKNPMSGTRWFQLVEIQWQSKCRVLRPLPPWTANSKIRVVTKQSSKRSVMISTHWRSQS